MRDLLHAIINGDDEFNAQFKDLMHGMGGEVHADLEPVDFSKPEVTNGLHTTLRAILEHLKAQGAPKQKVIQAVRDAGGRLVSAKVVETE
jgi:hypothetical protein